MCAGATRTVAFCLNKCMSLNVSLCVYVCVCVSCASTLLNGSAYKNFVIKTFFEKFPKSIVDKIRATSRHIVSFYSRTIL